MDGMEARTETGREAGESTSSLTDRVLVPLVVLWIVASVVWGSWYALFDPGSDTGSERLASALLGILGAAYYALLPFGLVFLACEKLASWRERRRRNEYWDELAARLAAEKRWHEARWR
jgi:hypothetical protein